jgi:hypothetical protein
MRLNMDIMLRDMSKACIRIRAPAKDTGMPRAVIAETRTLKKTPRIMSTSANPATPFLMSVFSRFVI